MNDADPLNLSAEELHALQVVGRTAKHKRNDLEPGKAYPVDLWVRIKGSLAVGTDSTSTTTAKPKPEDLLAAILSSLPDPARANLLDVMNGWEGTLPEPEEGWLAAAKTYVTAYGETKTGSRKGSVRGAFEVGVISAAELTPQTKAKVENATRLITFDDDEKKATA